MIHLEKDVGTARQGLPSAQAGWLGARSMLPRRMQSSPWPCNIATRAARRRRDDKNARLTERGYSI